MNMTLTEAMKRLEIFAGQQMSDEMETAIRTVLAEMKQRTKVVRCSECCHQRTYHCPLYYGEGREERTSKNNFCSHAKRKK